VQSPDECVDYNNKHEMRRLKIIATLLILLKE
jgi:hypothetical protein